LEFGLAAEYLPNAVQPRYPHDVGPAESKSLEDEPLPEYREVGVDVSLIRWMLSLSPAERLQFLQERVDSIREIRQLNG